jgi:hypothetical protein
MDISIAEVHNRLSALLKLAEKTVELLITGDERMFNAVHGELDWGSI